MINVDYQWPSNILALPSSTGGMRDAEPLRRELEDRFSSMFGFESLVVPSGRAALALALRSSGVDRRHVVFAPRFSSHCVWNVVGRFANPTVNFADPPDVTVAVHKFGIPHGFHHRPSVRTLIEDSCDSIVLRPDACFPNDGAFEIFSLPKIMGSYGGGVLVCRTSELAAAARLQIERGPAIGESQGILRWKIAAGISTEYNAWDANEFENFHPDQSLLRQLLEGFDQIEENRRIIESRLRVVNTLKGGLISTKLANAMNFRLPPVASSPRLAECEGLMVRHINESAWLDEPRFAKHGLLPLHFGVDDRAFDGYIKLAEAALG